MTSPGNFLVSGGAVILTQPGTVHGNIIHVIMDVLSHKVRSKTLKNHICAFLRIEHVISKMTFCKIFTLEKICTFFLAPIQLWVKFDRMKELLTGTVANNGNRIDWVSLTGFPVEHWFRSVPVTTTTTVKAWWFYYSCIKNLVSQSHPWTFIKVRKYRQQR